MAQTCPLVTGWFDSFANASSRNKDVGSGANRRAAALIGYNSAPGSGGGIPSGFTVGSDTLTLVGSVVTLGSGLRWALYEGALTVSGTQTCTGSFSGTIGSGGAYVDLQVTQGGGSLTFGNATTVNASEGSGAAGSSSETMNSTTSDVAYKLAVDISGLATASGSGDLGNDSGFAYMFNQKAAGQAGTTTITTNWAAAYGPVEVGFTYTEATVASPPPVSSPYQQLGPLLAQ